MTINFLIYVALGKLLIYIGQKFLGNSKSFFFNKLVNCDLCLGVWVYTILAGLYQIRLLEDVLWYVPIASELITGIAVSFIVHLLSIGVREKFGTVIV